MSKRQAASIFGTTKKPKISSSCVWNKVDSVLVGNFSVGKGRSKVEGKSKIAGFDVDGTIITTKGKHVHAKDWTDWKLKFPSNSKNQLSKLHSNGYKICFISNQLKPKCTEDQLKKKFENIAAEFNIPIQIFLCRERDQYRKPMPFLWDLVASLNDGVDIDKEKSFFVGDAAGRGAGWQPKAKKDFSCSDRKFALNAGIRFHTPEEFFLKSAVKAFSLGVDPRKVPKSNGALPLTPRTDCSEILINVGFPGSGKTFFTKKFLEPKGYVHVNQDTLKTKEKCEALCKKSLCEGKSVVIDNTNLEPHTRKGYVDIAKKHKVPVRCLHFTANTDLCIHNDIFRSLTSNKTRIPGMVFAINSKKYQEPKLSEGFEEIISIPFTTRFAKNDPKGDLYHKFLS